jgi:DNA invertase Pin-like site-specific DNA recombinase
MSLAFNSPRPPARQTYWSEKTALSCRAIPVQNEPMIYGCARVSTDGQSADAKARRLTKVGRKRALREVASGTETVMQLAHTTRELLNAFAAITGEESGFRPLADAAANTTTEHGRLMLTVLHGLTEFGGDLIRPRSRDINHRAISRLLA